MKYTITYNATYSVSGNVYNSPSISQAIDAIAAKGARRYYVECIASNSYSDTYSDNTSSNTSLIVDVISANYINVFAITVGNQYGVTMYRAKSTSWGNWVKQPIRNEMDALSSKQSITATFPDNTYSITNSLKITKCGNICTVSGILVSSTAIANNTTLCTLPSGARPMQDYYFVGFDTNCNGGRFYISTDGKVMNQSGASLPVGNIFIDTSFICA